MSFRPQISRIQRIAGFLRTKPRQMMRVCPEQVYCAFICFGIGGAMAFYKIVFCGDINGTPPYYRGFYDVVRPSDPAALQWRVPEDYPAYYLTNRDVQQASTYKRDYGWESKL